MTQERWFVRSIEPQELPAVCRFCPRQRLKPQARVVIGCRVVHVDDKGQEIHRTERTSPACVDHGVYVQQRYILPQGVPA